MSRTFGVVAMFLRFAACIAFVCLGFVAGCGGSEKAAKAPAGDGYLSERAAGGDAAAKEAAERRPGEAGDPAAVKGAAAPAQRKIVYTATLEIVVPNMDEALPQVEKLVAAQKGYVAKSEVKGDTGTRRTATYSLRVPVDGFPATREGLLALGSPERNAVDSQDVTEEFVDVQARIKNLKEQEDKLNELLKEKRKEEKLDDIIKVSDRIADVRRDVERVQGRLNYLANMSALATINLTLKEIKDYKPPTAPTFRNRIGSAFEASWDALVALAQGLALFAVRLGPWLPILVPAVVALVWAVRRFRREWTKAPTVATPPESTPPAEGSPGG